MGKKSRRAKARQRARLARMPQVTRMVQEAAPQQAKSMPARTQSALRTVTKTEDLASRYKYVIPELKRIGIIAGSIIVVIIVLSFVLPVVLS